MSVYHPSWTHGGPYDDRSAVTLDASQQHDVELIEEGMQSTRDPDRWFFAAERLASAFPEWLWAKFRLAYAHLLLEDADGALDLFEDAKRLGQAPDKVFNEWLELFRQKIEEEREAEDRSWSEPEDGGVIVQSWKPPRDLDAFKHEVSSSSSPVLEEWIAYRALGAAAERYARLVAVQSSSLEGVFLLGGESMSTVVRKGVCTEAIAEVVQGPPGGVESVVEILQDFNKCLEEFASSAQRRVSVSHDDVKAIHAQLMRSSRIGYAEFPGEAPIPYLNTVGQYRRRIVTASMDSSGAGAGGDDNENEDDDGEGEKKGQNEDDDTGADDDDDDDDDEPWKVVQFARHQEVEAHMGTFLDMLNAKLAEGERESQDPFVLAAWTHYNLAIIHPFTDGNGRVIRILASLPLLKAGLPYINVRPEVKPAYLAALHMAATDEDLGPLARLIADEMRESIGWLRNLQE
ncbi:Fic-domain-containing protein [Lentinus tigrinus ALCF2SS1-7]|uniref:protein adenylyltransferase n=1 Tax=Lentinus tigrinus ALCF2SS1-6 TaxID=1328759 RepID=A0A5C2S3M3_9APHY|nr:Fic-domain-containing protein [Lentinus tigrinus ALCF2SS1-6]RPD72218.1 Fic-domain-containing protein [Lentinus tigrinus ALCF2SS1-7]